MTRLQHRDGQWLAPEPGKPESRAERLHQTLVREKGDSAAFGFIMGWGIGAALTVFIYQAGLMIG
jgi:hypothetical protein